MRLDLLINDFVYRALREKSLILYEKEFKRTFIHVRDMARSFAFAIDNCSLTRLDHFPADEAWRIGAVNFLPQGQRPAKGAAERH